MDNELILESLDDLGYKREKFGRIYTCGRYINRLYDPCKEFLEKMVKEAQEIFPNEEIIYDEKKQEIRTKGKFVCQLSEADFNNPEDYIKAILEAHGYRVLEVDALDWGQRDYSNETDHGNILNPEHDEVTWVQGRMDDYNDLVLEDFWNFNYKDEMEYLKEEYPEIVVYHRKGKDWYVHLECDVLECELGSFLVQDLDHEADVEKVVKFLEGSKKHLEFSCEIHNLFESEGDAPEELKDYIDKNYPDFNEFVESVGNEGSLDKWIAKEFPEKLEDLPYQLVTDGNGAYCFDWGKHGVFHFRLMDLFEDGFLTATEIALQKRKTERIKNSEIFAEASKVFIGFQDSLDSGNCKLGSEQFCKEFGLNPEYGYRGDYILELRCDIFTLRAVNRRLKNAKY